MLYLWHLSMPSPSDGTSLLSSRRRSPTFTPLVSYTATSRYLIGPVTSLRRMLTFDQRKRLAMLHLFALLHLLALLRLLALLHLLAMLQTRMTPHF